LIETDLAFTASPVEPFSWRGLDFFVKRDDLIDSRFSGNKFRKLYSLFKLKKESVKRVVSYGGAQSNAMLSIAYLAAMKGWEFDYYVKSIPTWLENDPTGNLKRALELGMRLHQLGTEEFYDSIESIRSQSLDGDLFIPQGGADPVAIEGVRILASEILEWADGKGLESFCVATPSGTGTTALYLRKSLPENIKVVTTPVVGDEKILRAQWHKLEPDLTIYPDILFMFGKHQFAKPHPAFLQIWNSLKDSGIEFDLVYAPKMWYELEKSYDRLPKPILYLHSGGVSGNVSQLQNYAFRGIGIQ